MGKKSIMKMLLSLAFFQVCYIIAIIVGFTVGVLLLVNQGLLYSPNEIGETVQELTQKIEADDLSSFEIPDYIEYARLSADGQYMEGTIKDEELLAQVVQEGQIIQRQLINGITYRYISGSVESWVLGYQIANAQFSNKFLKSIFPSADVAIVLLLFVAIIIGFWLILNSYRNSLSKELKKITSIRNTILSDSHDISKLSSNIKEVNEIIAVLDDMEKLVKSSMKKQLEQSRLLEEGIQAITHDIQTPATVVSGNIELLEETQIDEKQQEYLQYAKDGIYRISNYVAELKTLSKLEKEEYEKRSFDNEFISDLVMLAKGIAALKNISIVVKAKESADELLIDRNDVIKVYQNILSNAIEKSSADTVVELNFVKTGNEYIVSVIDQGRGFTSEGLKKATNKFYSENRARNSEHRGLGLSIAEQIMREYSGRVVIENIKTDVQVTGAKVSLVFPLHKY